MAPYFKTVPRTHTMQRFLPILFFLTLLLAGPLGVLHGEATGEEAKGGAAVSPWVVAQEAAFMEGIEGVRHEAWSSQRPPAGEHDRIGLHRYRGQESASAALLYFPGTFMNGEVAVTEEDHNLFLFLARRGVDVYTLDYRTHGVSHEEDGDLRFMASWGMETFTDDALAALAFVGEETEGLPLFVAGFSRGVAFAYAAAAAQPQAVAGIVALDGFFKRAAPKGDGPRDPQAALAAGKRWAHDVGGSRGWKMRQGLMEAAAADPSSPAFGGEGTVGAQLAEILHGAWGPGALANPVRGLKDKPGDSTSEGASQVAVLARLMAGYDRYYPVIQDLEAAAWSDVADDPRTPMDDGWPSLRKPVFFVGSTGMGARFLMDGLASAAHCAQNVEANGAADPQLEIHVLEGHGHLDVLVGERAKSDVFEPMLEWIRRTARKK